MYSERGRYVINIYILYFCVCYLFLVDVQFFAGNERIFRKNGQKEFPTPLAGRADQYYLYKLHFFFTSFKSYDFLKFV